MDFFAVCPRGAEEFAAREAGSMQGMAASVSCCPGVIRGHAKSFLALARFAYHTRLCDRVVLELTFAKIPPRLAEATAALTLDGIEKFVQRPFGITVVRHGDHVFTSHDLSMSLGERISSMTGMRFMLKSAPVRLFAFVHDDCALFGVDLCGFDLGRRDFRVFLRHDSLRGSVAAAVLAIAGWKETQTLLDPFCRDGIIPIEAALRATGRSPHLFTKGSFVWQELPADAIPDPEQVFVDDAQETKARIIALDNNFSNLSASRKNAKIAGVIRAVELARKELEWFDVKLGKNSIDHIITQPPQPGRATSSSQISTLYHLLFERAAFILAEDGRVTTVTRRGTDLLLRAAKEKGFVMAGKHLLYAGGEQLHVIVFSR